jgi:hypothetical protein
MSYYQAAMLVDFEVPTNDDLLLPSLLMMEQNDHEFVQLVLSDDYLRKIYTKQLEHRISAKAKKKVSVRLGITLIVSALKNRTRFAIQQKERLKCHVNLLCPPDLKSYVIREVNSELRRVIALISHFTGCDQDLHDMSYEAGRCVNDNLEYGYPALILPSTILSAVEAVRPIVIKAALHPSARIVSYEVARNDDLLLPSLLMMEQDDHEFVKMLVSEQYLKKLYTQLKHRLSEKVFKKRRLGMMLIVRALKNRTRFAIQQKERLKYHVNLLRPPALRTRVICEVNDELRRVIAMIAHFTCCDQDLHDMSYEAGRCVNDNLEVPCGYPALIEDDEE